MMNRFLVCLRLMVTNAIPFQSNVAQAQDDGTAVPAPSAAPAKAAPSTSTPSPASGQVPGAAASAPRQPVKGAAASKKPVTPAAQAPQVPPPSRELPECQNYLATPIDGSVLQIGTKLYYVSPKLPGDKTPGTLYLVETDLEAGRSKRLASFRGSKSASLLAHGKTADAISVIDFSGGRPECGEGKTSATAIKWSEQKVLPSFAAGHYGYVEGDGTGYLADLDKGLVQDIDLSSGQKRTLETFEAGVRPLFIKASPPVAVYNYNPRTRELSRFSNNNKAPDSTLRLKEGMRLIQQGHGFGIQQIKNGGKTLQISIIKDWSGNEFRSFDLNLPPGFSPNLLATRIIFDKAQVLLFGKDEAARKSLRQVLFYTGKDLTRIFKAPDGAFFSSARFSREDVVILQVADSATDVVKELWWAVGNEEIRRIDVIKDKKTAPVKTP